jgi:hypothetical protein
MDRRDFVRLPLLPAWAFLLPAQGPARPGAAAQAPPFEAWLSANHERFHTTLDVYTDAFAAGNHFHARGRIYSDRRPEAESLASRALPPMDEAFVHPGRPGTCIRARFLPNHRRDWGGWAFQHGVLDSPDNLCPGGTSAPPPVDNRGVGDRPVENWGTVPNAGLNLTGATELSCLARGSRGGELVRLFAFGAGWENGRQVQPHAESQMALESPVELSNTWTRVPISLNRLSLSNVMNGFGWVVDAGQNDGRPVEFFIDDVRYNLDRRTENRLPLSFEAGYDGSDFSRVMRNVSFTYDAAMNVLAFLAVDNLTAARNIADALLVAQNSDRSYCDGRLRNAYQAGDLVLGPAWTPNGRTGTVRMPGWYGPDDRGTERWLEDRFTVSTHTGNLAWAMIAWLAMYEATPRQLPDAVRSRYLEAAARLGDWIHDHCRYEIGRGRVVGYTGGYNGWEPNPEKITYRSTEHNIDLVSAYSRLAAAMKASSAAKASIWAERADFARAFVEAMWRDDVGADGRGRRGARFWTGTLEKSPDAINEDPVPLDVQSWAVLALGQRGRRGENYSASLDFAREYCGSGDGFSFSTADRTGIWFEGTAQMSVAYRLVGRVAEADRLVELLRAARDRTSGAVPATNVPRLFTGFDSLPGIPWYYYRRPHTGATAWAVLAERRVNPFAPFRTL